MADQLQQQSQQLQQSSVSYPQQPEQELDPMAITIGDTLERLNRLRSDVSDMGNKIAYLRDIRPRAMALLAQADDAEAEANRLESERAYVEKEVERLKTVVARMEDMRFSTKQLTDQMLEDTAQQMRHILENGKSIVPRLPSARMSMKRSPSDEIEPGQAPLFKIPRRESTTANGELAAGGLVPQSGPGGSRPSSSATSNGSSASPAANKFSPNRNLSLTPNSSGFSNPSTTPNPADTPRSMATTGEPLSNAPLAPSFMDMLPLAPGPTNGAMPPTLQQQMMASGSSAAPLLTSALTQMGNSISNGQMPLAPLPAQYATSPPFPMSSYTVAGSGSSTSSAGGMSLYPPTGASLALALSAGSESTFMDDPSGKDVLYR